MKPFVELLVFSQLFFIIVCVSLCIWLAAHTDHIYYTLHHWDSDQSIETFPLISLGAGSNFSPLHEKQISLLLPVVPNSTCLTSSFLSLKSCSLSHCSVDVLCLVFYCRHCVQILMHTSIFLAPLAVVNNCEPFCVLPLPFITNMISSVV